MFVCGHKIAYFIVGKAYLNLRIGLLLSVETPSLHLSSLRMSPSVVLTAYIRLSAACSDQENSENLILESD